jgi:hypothetical protein
MSPKVPAAFNLERRGILSPNAQEGSATFALAEIATSICGTTAALTDRGSAGYLTYYVIPILR